MIRLIPAALFLALAVFVFFTEVVGFYKFDYVMNRMHAAALGDTMGIASVVIAAAILWARPAAILKLVLVAAFLFLTGPAMTHLIAGMELGSHRGDGREYREEDRR